MDKDRRPVLKPLEILLRYKYVLIVAAAGVLLLLWPGERTAGSGGGTTPVSLSPDKEPQTDMEKALKEILEQISGVGQVEVMLTLHTNGELVLAQNESLRYSGNVQSPNSYDRSHETVTVSGASGGQDVVITQEQYPQYRGALIVCDGGGNDAVRLQVIEAVSVLTGLSSDRISVVKRQAAGSGQG